MAKSKKTFFCVGCERHVEAVSDGSKPVFCHRCGRLVNAAEMKEWTLAQCKKKNKK